MLLSHAITLAEARSYLAALARHAHNDDASAEYERVLLQVDFIHGDYVPGLNAVVEDNRGVLFRLAEQAIEDLETYGLDPLQVDLLLDMLEVAGAKDVG